MRPLNLLMRPFAGNKTSRGLCPKCDCKACMYCLAGQNGHFQSQIVVPQPSSLLFVQPNDPSMFCDRFMDSFLYSFCYRRIVKRLEDFYECKVVNTYHNCHQGTNIPNGIRTFSVILNRHLPATLRFGRFQVCLFHRDQPQRCHKCNRCGHFARECPNLVCFNCDGLGHISKECPDCSRCCTCKSLNHLAINWVFMVFFHYQFCYCFFLWKLFSY